MANFVNSGGIAAVTVLIVFLVLSSFGGIAAFVIIVIANRADPDPTGKRPMAAYFFGGAFVTLWIAVIGFLVAVFSLVGLIGSNNYNSYAFGEVHPARDATIRGVSIGLLLVVIAGATHVLHARRGLNLSGSETELTSPTKRVERGYLAVISFISILVVVLALFLALYAVLGLIAPGVYHASNSTAQWKALLDLASVTLVFAGVFALHQKLIGPGLRLLNPMHKPPTAVEEAPSDTPSAT